MAVSQESYAPTPGPVARPTPRQVIRYAVGYRELFLNLVLRELRSKYRRSFFGWTWSLVNPLAYMVIYTVVFSDFLKAKPPTGIPSGIKVYALYLLCAMLPWNFFQNGVMTSIGSILGNANLIKKTYFPRAILPAAAVCANIVSHLIEMGLLLVAMLCFGNFRSLEFLPLDLVLIALVAIFSLGVGLAFSSINVYYRDVEWFITIFFMIWFFLTPIVYPPGNLGHTTLTILKLNPMTDAAFCFRSLLYDGRLFGMIEFSYFAVWAIAIFAAGVFIFRKLEPRFAEEL